MKRTATCILLLAVLFAVSAPAQSSLEQGADAVYLDISHEYILNPDGSTIYNYEHRLKYLTNFSFNSAYGESFIVYDPEWQTLKVTKCAATMADGRVVNAPFNAFNEVLPQWAAGMAPYVRLREMVVTHTGLEKNAVVNLAYTITTKKGFLPGLMGSVMFGDRSPIGRMTVRVKVPSGTSLAAGMARSDLKPVVTAENRYSVSTWTLEHIPLAAVEASQPPLASFLPVLLFSTAGMEDLQRHLIGDESSRYSLSPTAMSLAKEITKEKGSWIEKALELRAYVEANVGLMNAELPVLGYRAMRAQEVLDRNAGSQLDRAVLLAALCRAAGITAVPALTAVAPSLPTDVPSLNQFTNACVMCSCESPEGEMVFLDPNAPQNGPALTRSAGRNFLPLMKDAKITEMIGLRSEASTLEFDGDLTIGDDGKVEGTAKVKMTGGFDFSFAKEAAPGSVRTTLVKIGQGMRVTNLQTDFPKNGTTECSANVSSGSPLADAAGLVRFALPGAAGGLGDLHLSLGSAPRTTPVDFGFPFREEERWTIHLPENISVAIMPTPVNLKNEIGEVHFAFSQEGKDVKVVRTFVLNVPRVPVSEYGSIRSIVGTWQEPAHQVMVLKRP